MAGGNPSTKQKIVGVVLAGGRSSRMGQDKAVLLFQGRPMIDHMISLLHGAGCDDVFLSGQRSGYPCIPDNAPYQGPAMAIRHVMHVLAGYRGVLFVPVDMPLLTTGFLQQLLMQKRGAFFEGWPLPVCIMNPCPPSEEISVHGFLADIGLPSIPCPASADKFFINLNTPDEWKKAVKQ